VTGTVAAVAATAVVTGGASTVTAAASAGRVAMGIASAVRTTASASMMGMASYTGVEAGMAIGNVMNGGEWTMDTTMKVAALGLSIGGAGAGRMLGRMRANMRTPSETGPICFVQGTQVLAAGAAGTAVAKAIEDIEVGDLVWARDEFTGEVGFKPVVRLFRNTADRLVHLSYRRDPGSARRGSSGLKGGDAEDGDDLSATITGTDEHPFWSLCHSECECFSSDSATTPNAAPINSTTASIACIDVASPSMAIPAARPIPIPPSNAACRKRAGLNQPGLAAARAKKAAMPSSSPP
jgi:hypothetical protein